MEKKCFKNFIDLVQVVIPVPELCPVDQIRFVEEAHGLLSEDHREEYPEQQILFPGECEEGGVAVRSGAGGADLMVRVAQQ